MKQQNWCVYMHTNTKNGKRYIGISSNVKKRWAGNGSAYYDQVFGLAIQKHGWNSFSHEIIYDNLSKECACQKERELINKYQTYKKEFGYNISLGGDSGSYGAYDKEQKRMKAVFQYDFDGNFIQRHNSIASAVRQLRPDLNRHNSCSIPTCCLGKRQSALGYRWFYDYQGEKIDGILSPRERIGKSKSCIVYQYSLNGEYIQCFKSIAEAERQLKGSGIQCCTSGRSKTALGYQWRLEYQGEKIPPVAHTREKPIYQYDKYGKYLNKYPSRKVAKEKYGLSVIRDYYKNNRIMCGGYIWLDKYVGNTFTNLKSNI